MKYLSIDIETTGLDPKTCQILQIGIIIEDTANPLPFSDIPKLNLVIRHSTLSGSPTALAMNANLIKAIDSYKDLDDGEKSILSSSMNDAIFIHPEDIILHVRNFLVSNGFQFKGSLKSSSITFNAAGKNFGTFDKKFLEEIPEWDKQFKIRNRILDPAILYVDWKNDSSLPSLNQCKERAGIIGEVSHDAIEDAWDVIQTLRKFYV
jgi:oligoribonuclease